MPEWLEVIDRKVNFMITSTTNFELNEASFFMGISHIVYAPIPEHVFIALRAALAHRLEA